VSISAPPAAHVAARSTRHSLVPHWLTHLGAPGLFLVAAIDSSLIPLPLPGSTDLLLLLLVSHKGNPWLLAAVAIAGSILGGYTSWRTGATGGEAALTRYVQPRLLKRISGWVEHHAILSVFLPALLPPPIPLSPFLLASGALCVSRERFLIVFGAARSLRYGLIAWLGVTYGRGVVRLWAALLEKWSATLLWVFAVMLIGAVSFAIWKMRRRQKFDGVGNSAIGTAAPARAD
jgi:membrane protein YqaA with SNARE-associated domain